MYNAPRAATCRAQTKSTLWSLDRVSFKVIVVAAAMIKRELYQGFLEKVPILETCNPGEIQTLGTCICMMIFKLEISLESYISTE